MSGVRTEHMKQELFLHLSEIANKEHQVRGPRPKNRQSKKAQGKTTVFLPGVLALVPVCVCLSSCLSRVVQALLCRFLLRRLPCFLLFSGCFLYGSCVSRRYSFWWVD